MYLVGGVNLIENNEIWKDVVGYEGLYQVSNLGRVKSLEKKYTYRNRYGGITEIVKKEKMLKPSIQYPNKNKNYKRYKVSLTKYLNKKNFMVHSLVAKAFIDNPNNYSQINHKDGNPLNNNVNNLEWCSQKYNVQHSISKQLKKSLIPFDKIPIICKNYQSGMPVTDISLEYKVSKTTIYRILKKANVKIRTISEAKNKYYLNLNDLLNDFKSGLTNKEIQQKYNCSKQIVATRKYQLRKKELL